MDWFALLTLNLTCRVVDLRPPVDTSPLGFVVHTHAAVICFCTQPIGI